MSDRYLIQVRNDVDPQLIADLVDDSNTEVFLHAIHGFLAHLDMDEVQLLLADDRVMFVERETMASHDEVLKFARNSDDFWHLDQMGHQGPGMGFNGSFERRATGKGQALYVLDSGVYLGDPEFGSRASHIFTSVTEADGGVNNPGSTPNTSHGSQVASLAAGAVYGMAPDAQIYSLKTFNTLGKSGNFDNVAAFNYLIAHTELPRGVINCSFSGDYNPSGDQIMTNLVNAGFTVVVSAGNTGGYVGGSFPASTADSISVGSYNRNRQISSFSTFGNGIIDVIAPGEQVKTAFGVVYGTSFSAPIVAGLVLQMFELWGRLPARAVRDYLLQNADLSFVDDRDLYATPQTFAPAARGYRL